MLGKIRAKRFANFALRAILKIDVCLSTSTAGDSLANSEASSTPIAAYPKDCAVTV